MIAKTAIKTLAMTLFGAHRRVPLATVERDARTVLDLLDGWDDYLSDRLHLARTGHHKIVDHVFAEMAAAGDRGRPTCPVPRTTR